MMGYFFVGLFMDLVAEVMFLYLEEKYSVGEVEWHQTVKNAVRICMLTLLIGLTLTG